MYQRSLIDDSDVDRLGEATCSVLERVGVFCENDQILDALEAYGAQIDRPAKVATIPRPLTASFAQSLRSESPAPALDEPRFVPPPPPSVGTQVAPLYYDYPQGRHRGSTRADLIETAKLGHMLGGAGHALSLTDVPPMTEPLEAALILAEYAPDAAPAFAWHVDQIDYLIEMGQMLGKEDWFAWGAICFVHPLRFDKAVADKFVRRVREGEAASLTAMPVAGATTPATVAGFIAVAAAEMVVTWMAGRALNPDVPLTGSIWAGTLDMKTGAVSYSAFDAMGYGFALAEFLRQWCGHDLTVGGGEYCDAKAPGYYAALEKAHKAMTIAAFNGGEPHLGQGMLDEGRIFCPVQLLLEREFADGMAHLMPSIDSSDEALGLDTIFDIAHGLDRNYLAQDHTIDHYRQSLWCPQWLDRSGWRGAEQEQQVLDSIQRHIDELLAAYEKPEIDLDALAEARAVLDRARKQLL